jgi:hypothetical protein
MVSLFLKYLINILFLYGYLNTCISDFVICFFAFTLLSVDQGSSAGVINFDDHQKGAESYVQTMSDHKARITCMR